MSYATSRLKFPTVAATGVAGTFTLNGRTLQNAQLFVSGTFVATWKLEVSADAITFQQARDIAGNTIGSTSGDTAVTISGDANQVRFNVTAYTSGTIASAIVMPGGN